MARRTAVLTVALIAAFVVLVDQATKAWAVHTLKGQPPVEVIGDLLRWAYTTNSGAAFSIGNGNAWLFTFVAAGLIGVVVFYTFSVTNRWWATAMGLVLGGGLGNLLDRLFREPGAGQGHVVDFITIPHWPVFNVADMAVVGGALLAAVLSLRGIDYKDRHLGRTADATAAA